MVSLLLPVIYLAFISLGLPDALLGAAWPSMYPQLGAGVSWAGGVSMIISVGTIVSSLASDWLNNKLGTGRVTALSVATTAVALFGFSTCTQFWQLCLWAVPYGLGAGSVDAALNNYVSLHYESRHMSWLHCMWGIGAAGGPVIMGWALAGSTWQNGYRIISILQIVLTAVLIFSLPLWQTPADAEAFMAAGADIILLPAPGTVPGITQEYAHKLIGVVHSRGKLALTAIGTSQEGADVSTIRQIALMCKMAGADIHHIGDTGVPGMALPQNIMAYSIAIRGERHTYHKMAQSVNR